MPGSVTVRLGPNCCRRLRAASALALSFALALTAIPLYAGSSKTQKPGQPKTQKHESRHEIDQLEDDWRNAILTSDIKTMDSLLSEDYMAITPSGTLQNKEEALANLRSGRVHFTTLTISDRKVRFYGTTAVVTSLAEIQATTPDGPVSGNYRYTRVYVRDPQGKWKIVSFEASRVREAGPHHKSEFH